MKIKKIVYSLLMFIFATALAFTGWQSVSAQSAQPVSTSGWFSIVLGDGRSGETTSMYTLTDDSGQTSTLVMNDALAAPLGGVLALNRHRITISGIRRVSASAAGGQSTIQVEQVALENSQEAAVKPETVTGSFPFITIMCKFQGIAAEPKTLTYFNNMYSNVYPGLDDYWQEVSYLTANIAGSTAVGWYTLPHPHDYYILADGSANLQALAQDCTGVADPTVNFAPFDGINMMFNSDLDGFAWGGGQCVTVDGASQCWRMTWEPPWGYSDITVLSHEMGHAFGLPHSSGQYGQTYDNQWDVMSDTWSNCSRSTDPTYGCLGQQINSYHKDMLGWIPASKKYTASWGTNATITMEQLGVPTTSNYLIAKILINGSSTHFYTVEVRRQTGYDIKLPGQGVIIHDVDVTRVRPANVIDADGNGNTGDAGAIWTVGERFSDTANGIYVKVVSATATGFVVSIQTPLILKALTTDGWVLESGENTSLGGTLNGTATTFKLGDDAANRQFRSILPFDTSTLPDNAVVIKVKLKIMKQAAVGTDPFTTHGVLRADIRKSFFGTGAGLEAVDFQAGASAGSIGSFGVTPANNWYTATLSAAANPYVNRTGPTQLRLRFNLDDNNDLGADYVSFYSGNYPTLANRPQLVVQYYVP